MSAREIWSAIKEIVHIANAFHRRQRIIRMLTAARADKEEK